jgi:hypothetical protein
MGHWSAQLLSIGRNPIGKEVYDLMRTMDVLQAIPSVDKKRIGAIGHSAGGNALAYFMFADDRVKLGASSCGVFEMANWFDEKAPMKRSGSIVIPNLVKVARTHDFVGYIAPRPFLMTRGLNEWGWEGKWGQFSKNHVEETKKLESGARKYYQRKKADRHLNTIYFDGIHAFPPEVKEQVYRWIDSYLKK